MLVNKTSKINGLVLTISYTLSGKLSSYSVTYRGVNMLPVLDEGEKLLVEALLSEVLKPEKLRKTA